MSKSKEQQKDTYNSDITKHDLDILNQKNIHGDGGDDQQLKDRKNKVDFEGKDLDIPGRTTAKKGNGPKGLNDEENKLHSQGGSENENLERDDSAV
ncbi:hypothetical protein [Cochleicola gelatinilyticus]|uniref:Uncharacterized protein n=1 Tax=Cochleicola gelatinilyticus TaxID=1763537 RepID=A0A167GYI9_9FLAO|nr:hypothetical protein [Cochleicola gelatinilyticus]OAB78038.1 hypothetical protein ULVI_11170 [Cochleicola gelatinilyticus]